MTETDLWAEARELIEAAHEREVDAVQRAERAEADLAAARAELAELRREADKFAGRLGFGDNVSEPAATLEQMVEPIEWAFSEARDHGECPVLCELCGETLAGTDCEYCHGAGCLPNPSAYDECQWCAGAGRIHEGCVEKSYDDLTAELAAQGRVIAATQAAVQLVAEDVRYVFGDRVGDYVEESCRQHLRAALADADSTLAEVKVDRRPCRGRNSNVCVAEGCYDEACLRATQDGER